MSEKNSLWFKPYTVEDLQAFRHKNMGVHVGIELVAVEEQELIGRMPVDHRTTQPFGLLHGGASCVLSESLGSIAAWMCIDPDLYAAVGIEINANHLRSVREGWVRGICRPLHTGRRTHVWQTDIYDEATDKQICTSRLTVAIIEKTAA